MVSAATERFRGPLLWGLVGFVAAAGLINGRLAAQDAAPAEAEAGEAAAEESSPPGEIRFVGKNRIATAKSVFHEWKIASLELNRENLAESTIEIEVDVASLDTGIARRDEHLRTPDFFDVEKFPTAKIRVYDVRPDETGEAGTHRAKLDLTIRDVTQTREIDFLVLDEETMKVSGEITILRTDFGVGEAHKSLNPMSVEDEVMVSFEATLDPDSGGADKLPAS
jgi:polyisoprenoid-binding protein YceI